MGAVTSKPADGGREEDVPGSGKPADGGRQEREMKMGTRRPPRLSRLVLGTTSPHKLREMRALLGDLPLTVVPMAALGRPPEVNESGATFAENARLKALALSAWCGEAVVADDSGLEVAALEGAPGILSARFAGPQATDEDRNARLLDLLAGVPAEARGARYVCAIALAAHGRVVIETEGTLRGRIAFSPCGSAGFGYDPLFIPEAYDRTVGELGDEVKHRISHRARALAAFKERLAQWLREG